MIDRGAKHLNMTSADDLVCTKSYLQTNIHVYILRLVTLDNVCPKKVFQPYVPGFLNPNNSSGMLWKTLTYLSSATEGDGLWIRSKS
jgi:hypothetical protein